MTRRTTFIHEFVRHVPELLAEGVLYVSIDFTTALHSCFCGCGSEAVTPLSPTDWSLTFNGQTVSLYPSVGSWSLPCRSHYWVSHGRVIWAHAWTDDEIAAGRYQEYLDKRDFYGDPRHHGEVTSHNDSGVDVASLPPATGSSRERKP